MECRKLREAICVVTHFVSLDFITVNPRLLKLKYKLHWLTSGKLEMLKVILVLYEKIKRLKNSI